MKTSEEQEQTAPIVFSGNSIAPSAGTITETIPGNERQIQFALKLQF